MLRDFVYLNTKLVQQFISQLQGSVFDEETERTSQTGKGGLRGAVRVPVAELAAEKGKEHTTERERILRQTPESQFNRLHECLSADELIFVEQEIDDAAFVVGLRRSALLDIADVTLNVSGFQQVAALAKHFDGLMPLMTMLGGQANMDEDTQHVMAQLSALDDGNGPLPVIAKVPGDAKVVIALELDRQYILDQIAGEASLLVRVNRVLKKNEIYLVGDPTGGLVALGSRANRRVKQRLQ